MREVEVASAALGLILGVLAAVPASAWDRTDGAIINLALPALVNAAGRITADRAPVEGLTVGPDNRIYAASNGRGSTIGNLFVFDNATPPNFYIGQTTCIANPVPPAEPAPCSVPIQNSSNNILGIRFVPGTNNLWVLDGSDPPQILEVNPADGTSTRLAITFDPRAVLNGITFDPAGNAYVSDSGLGRIYQIPAGNPAGTNIWSFGGFMGDPLLLPQFPRTDAPCPPPNMNPSNPACPNLNGITPPFGANGIEFYPPGCTPGTGICSLLVANTANRQILQIFCCNPNNPGRALPASVLVNGVNGPDGIAVDPATNFIWVAANQSDEIVVIQPTTLPRVIAKLSDFNGINAAGRLNRGGVLFPTSLAFSCIIGIPTGNTCPGFPLPAQRTLYVANSVFTSAAAIDTEWAQLVTLFTVAIIPVPTIPPCLPGVPPQNCGFFRP